jgi:hypothetical protein
MKLQDSIEKKCYRKIIVKRVEFKEGSWPGFFTAWA